MKNLWVSSCGLEDDVCVVNSKKIEKMGHFSSLFNGLARSFSVRKARNRENVTGVEVYEEMVKEAKKNNMYVHRSGTVNSQGSDNIVSLCTKRGQKGPNQDCVITWEGFGCQEDMIFCGVFDGHGHWGHYVAKKVRRSMPLSLLFNWQETLALNSLDGDLNFEKDLDRWFDVWKQSYLKACAAIDHQLKHDRELDSFHSGTTALSIVRQGEMMIIANVGDSRAVLATTSDEGNLVPVQLTMDFKPNLPQEAERIKQSKGRVFCLGDEPGVYRVWLPNEESPGLAMSRAFGDYCIKDYGLISVPEITQRRISTRDRFVVLATDGVWDVISNQEAVDIVSSTPERGEAAKRLVQCAVRAWKRKRRVIALDDMSAVCLFFHSSPSS